MRKGRKKRERETYERMEEANPKLFHVFFLLLFCFIPGLSRALENAY
jgi:hypothetical protein